MDISLPLDNLQSGCKFTHSLRDSNNPREKIKLSENFSVKKHRRSFSRIKSSVSQPGLVKPRPLPKISRKEESLSRETGFYETRRHDFSSSACMEIEKLVLQKRYSDALEFFEFLGSKGEHEVEVSTYDALINACIKLRSSRCVRMVFKHIVDSGVEADLYMRNRVLLMHLKCGMMRDAWKLFDEMPVKNYVTWNTMIAGLVESGYYVEAFRLFMTRKDYTGAGPRMISPMIRAAAGLGMILTGQQLHCVAVKLGIGFDGFISCTLIDMYSKCGSIEDAQFVFDQMPEKITVAWNSIIAAYALHGYSEEALAIYYQMQESGVKMTPLTFSMIITVCTRLASPEQAKQAHAALVRHGFGLDMVANTALVDFYGKWGRIEDARNVFDKMPKKNIISWNALIGGYGYQGRGLEAVELFKKMLDSGIVPNHVTFLAVLSACSYSGLRDIGWDIFKSMAKDFKVKPGAMHYACMIELLGREGLIDEAYSLICNARLRRPSLNMWAALLTACRVHKNFVLGELAAEKLYGMQPKKLSNYVVLLNIYNSSGKMEEAAAVVQTLKKHGLRMVPSCTWIEVKKKQEHFYSAGKRHPQSDEIYENLESLMLKISKHGYVAEEKSSLPDVDEQEQRLHLYHSEKLAVSFGIISTPSGSPLQLVQSHRMCDDCHNAIKLIAMVTDREIVIRDGSRFHRFKNGLCSCGDYW